jgi:hypothetical protein
MMNELAALPRKNFAQARFVPSESCMEVSEFDRSHSKRTNDTNSLEVL